MRFITALFLALAFCAGISAGAQGDTVSISRRYFVGIGDHKYEITSHQAGIINSDGTLYNSVYVLYPLAGGSVGVPSWAIYYAVKSDSIMFFKAVSGGFQDLITNERVDSLGRTCRVAQDTLQAKISVRSPNSVTVTNRSDWGPDLVLSLPVMPPFPDSRSRRELPVIFIQKNNRVFMTDDRTHFFIEVIPAFEWTTRSTPQQPRTVQSQPRTARRQTSRR